VVTGGVAVLVVISAVVFEAAGVVVVVTNPGVGVVELATVETTAADETTVASGRPCKRFVVRSWSNKSSQERRRTGSFTSPGAC